MHEKNDDGDVIRAALLAVSAITTGFSLGRKFAGRQVERRKELIVAEAADEARLRIRTFAHGLVKSSTRVFLRRVLFKALILSLIWFGYWFELLPPAALKAAMAAAIAIFIVADIVLNWSVLRILGAEIRRHGLKPKTALSEAVAVRVFNDVLEETERRGKGKWQQKVLLAVAGKDRDRLSVEIAAAVSAVARETSWADLRPFLVSASVRFGILTALYTGFAALIALKVTSVS